MNSRKALLVAVVAIFASAFAADLLGLVERAPAAAATAGPAEGPSEGAPAEGAAQAAAAQAAADARLERNLRIGIMGAFACVSLLVVLRYRGVF